MHCDNFKDTWKRIKDWCGDHNVVAHEMEAGDMQIKQYTGKFNPMYELVDGFPTIIVKGKNNAFTVMPSRSEKYIVDFLKQETYHTQSGGSAHKRAKYRLKHYHEH
jgi:hypothetical protein